jgi:hypothetical protein
MSRLHVLGGVVLVLPQDLQGTVEDAPIYVDERRG